VERSYSLLAYYFLLIKSMKLKSIDYGAIIYLIILFLVSVSGGILLAAYNTSQFIWIGNLLIVLRLAQIGSPAITLAIAWISMWFWASVFVWAKPFKLLSDYPPPIALFLLLSWSIAMAIVFLLGFAKPQTDKLGLNIKQSTYGLTILVWGAMIIGWNIYQWI